MDDLELRDQLAGIKQDLADCHTVASSTAKLALSLSVWMMEILEKHKIVSPEEISWIQDLSLKSVLDAPHHPLINKQPEYSPGADVLDIEYFRKMLRPVT